MFSAGVWYDDPQSVNLAREIASKSCVTFKGLYIHEGNSYNSQSEDDIKKTASESFKRLNIFSNRSGVVLLLVNLLICLLILKCKI